MSNSGILKFHKKYKLKKEGLLTVASDALFKARNLVQSYNNYTTNKQTLRSLRNRSTLKEKFLSSVLHIQMRRHNHISTLDNDKLFQ